MSRAARLMAILPNVLTDGYPKSFYTGRRGSFPVAPGLVDFLETQRAKSGPVMEDEQALVVGEKRVEGLVRRFRINVSPQ